MEENPYQAPVEITLRRHSPFGVASFLSACLSAPILLVLAVSAVLIDARRGSESLETIGSVAAVLFCVGSLRSIGLGIIGLLQKGRRKFFAGIGLTLGYLLVGCLVLLAVNSKPRPLGGPVRIDRRR